MDFFFPNNIYVYVYMVSYIYLIKKAAFLHWLNSWDFINKMWVRIPAKEQVIFRRHLTGRCWSVVKTAVYIRKSKQNIRCSMTYFRYNML